MKLISIISIILLVLSSLGAQNADFAVEYEFKDNNIIYGHINPQTAHIGALYPLLKGGSGSGRGGSSRSKGSGYGISDDFINDFFYLLIFLIILVVLSFGGWIVTHHSKRKKQLEEKKSQYRIERLLKLIISKNIKKTTYKELASLMSEIEGFNDYSYQRARWDLKKLNIIQEIKNTQPKTIYIDLEYAKELAIEKKLI